MLKASSLFTVFILIFGLSACAPSSLDIVSETDEKQYQLAKNYQLQGRTDEALSAFLRVINVRRDAPESHLEAGNIYLNAFKDPISSIYHLKRYLQLKPNSAQAVQVQQLIETAEKEFARQLPASPYESQFDRVDLLDLMQALKVENDRLKQGLVAAEQRLAQYEGIVQGARRATPISTQVQNGNPNGNRVTPIIAPVPTAPQAAVSNPNSNNIPRTYIVQQGDTLTRISKRFYKTTGRWFDIYQANRDRIASPNDLIVGQEIRLP
jgi:tetratricopeptide (TPR) repeat protein